MKFTLTCEGMAPSWIEVTGRAEIKDCSRSIILAIKVTGQSSSQAGTDLFVGLRDFDIPREIADSAELARQCVLLTQRINWSKPVPGPADAYPDNRPVKAWFLLVW